RDLGFTMVSKPIGSIVGVGCTKFGNVLSTPEIKNKTFHELIAEAAFEAMDDAGMTGKDIDAFYVGSMLSHTSHMYSHHTQLCDWLGMQLKPSLHFATACSTLNTGLGLASMAVASGKFKTVLVVGAETLSSQPDDNPIVRKAVDPTDLWYWTDFGVDQIYGYHHCYDIATAYGAIPTMGYARKYGLSPDKIDETMYHVHKAVRKHSSLNPKAFITESLEAAAKKKGFKNTFEYWKSQNNPYFAYPTRLLSALNTVDGASAYIVTKPSIAKKYHKQPVDIIGFHWAASNYPWYKSDPTDWAIDKKTFSEAYKMAKVKPKQLDYLYVHDCMQIYQLVLSEIAGYLNKGESWKAFMEDRTTYKGDKPMNTSGGRHGKGHAFAASPGAETYEIVKQMRGEAGKRQVKEDVKIAAQHNHGYGMHSAVTIMKKR
ncbi:thiolase family protein, partial [Candidatus Micrarchaeota archaeon]|nr:thiolase family protein [Candidatus Micrarchaeota archaeon]